MRRAFLVLVSGNRLSSRCSVGNIHSIRNSCAVMSCGRPTVDIIEKYDVLSLPWTKVEIGRASCRERVCELV